MASPRNTHRSQAIGAIAQAIGTIALSMIYSHIVFKLLHLPAHLVVACGLAVGARVLMLLTSKAIAASGAMQEISNLLQCIILHTRFTWRSQSGRSAVEVCWFVFHAARVYACCHDVAQSIELGAVSGMITIIVGKTLVSALTDHVDMSSVSSTRRCSLSGSLGKQYAAPRGLLQGAALLCFVLGLPVWDGQRLESGGALVRQLLFGMVAAGLATLPNEKKQSHRDLNNGHPGRCAAQSAFGDAVDCPMGSVNVFDSLLWERIASCLLERRSDIVQLRTSCSEANQAIVDIVARSHVCGWLRWDPQPCVLGHMFAKTLRLFLRFSCCRRHRSSWQVKNGLQTGGNFVMLSREHFLFEELFPSTRKHRAGTPSARALPPGQRDTDLGDPFVGDAVSGTSVHRSSGVCERRPAVGSLRLVPPSRAHLLSSSTHAAMPLDSLGHNSFVTIGKITSGRPLRVSPNRRYTIALCALVSLPAAASTSAAAVASSLCRAPSACTSTAFGDHVDEENATAGTPTSSGDLAGRFTGNGPNEGGKLCHWTMGPVDVVAEHTHQDFMGMRSSVLLAHVGLLGCSRPVKLGTVQHSPDGTLLSLNIQIVAL